MGKLKVSSFFSLLLSTDERLFISLGGGLIISSSTLFNDKFFDIFYPGILRPIEAAPKLRFYDWSFFFFEIGGFIFLEETKGYSDLMGLLKAGWLFPKELKLRSY